MKLEVERCGDEAAPYNAIRLDRVKEEDVVVAGARRQRRGVRGEVSRARVSGARCQYGSVVPVKIS
jgi:hypothetical protein